MKKEEKLELYPCTVCSELGELTYSNGENDPEKYDEFELSCDYCSGKGIIDHELAESEAKIIRRDLEAGRSGQDDLLLEYYW